MGDSGEILDTDNTNKDGQSEEKITVVGVRFRPCGKVYTFDAGDIEAGPGTKVVVDSDMGLSIGHVVTPKYEVLQTGARRKKVLRLATEEDFGKMEENKKFREEARAYCIEKAAALHLPMKVVDTETTLDRKKVVFYFTAEGRIDFRELVRELAAKFRTRIEMRQIGVRDEVKLLGGIGACGRQTCCSQFLTSFAPITIKMAKQQSLSINQNKLSGICGRLMCCLSYEYREYVEETPSAEPVKEEVAPAEETAGDIGEIVSGELPEDASVVNEVQAESEEPDDLETAVEAKRGGADTPTASSAVESKKRRRRRRRGRKSPQATKEAAAGGTAAQGETTAGQTGTGEKDRGGKKVRQFSKRRKFRRKKKK